MGKNGMRQMFFGTGSVTGKSFIKNAQPHNIRYAQGPIHCIMEQARPGQGLLPLISSS